MNDNKFVSMPYRNMSCPLCRQQLLVPLKDNDYSFNCEYCESELQFISGENPILQLVDPNEHATEIVQSVTGYQKMQLYSTPYQYRRLTWYLPVDATTGVLVEAVATQDGIEIETCRSVSKDDEVISDIMQRFTRIDPFLP